MLRGRGSITGLRPSPGHGADPPSPGALSGRRRPDTGSSRGDLERTHRLANSSRTKGTQGLLGRGSGRRGVGGHGAASTPKHKRRRAGCPIDVHSYAPFRPPLSGPARRPGLAGGARGPERIPCKWSCPGRRVLARPPGEAPGRCGEPAGDPVPWDPPSQGRGRGGARGGLGGCTGNAGEAQGGWATGGREEGAGGTGRG